MSNGMIKLCVFLTIGFLIFACISSAIGLYFGIYNKIIGVKQSLESSIGDLNTEYQRRYALIDNLVSITKETKIFEEVLVGIEKEIYVKTAEAKASATKMNIQVPETIAKRISTENQLGAIITNALDKLMVMAQHYPQISDPMIKDRNKTFESLDKLRLEIKGIEGEILHARKTVNEYIRVYNSAILMFPGNLVAGQMGQTKTDFYDTINEEAKKDVKISF